MRVGAKIMSIRQETPTVKSFEFDLGAEILAFKPGQWVDFFVRIDGAEAVGGYSITSSPMRQHRVGLAVKLGGDNPVTHFLHTRARVGDRVEMRLGGDFYYTRDMADSIVLLAGGIGITPLMSIMRCVDEGAPAVDALLLHSAGTPSELLFRSELEDMAARNARLRYEFTVSQPAGKPWDGPIGRIDKEMLERAEVDLSALFFICGPPSMIRDMRDLLAGLGVPEGRIRYEQWW